MKNRTEQHKKDVEFGRSYSNVIVKHVEEHNHQIDWDNAMCLEKEKILYPRKILESAYIKENK